MKKTTTLIISFTIFTSLNYLSLCPNRQDLCWLLWENASSLKQVRCMMFGLLWDFSSVSESYKEFNVCKAQAWEATKSFSQYENKSLSNLCRICILICCWDLICLKNSWISHWWCLHSTTSLFSQHLLEGSWTIFQS